LETPKISIIGGRFCFGSKIETLIAHPTVKTIVMKVGIDTSDWGSETTIVFAVTTTAESVV
jgi:hypothetical protein